jgi:VanZ family protein
MSTVKHLGPLTAYTVYVFIAGSVRGSAPPGGISDKAAHFIGFGLMVPLALLAAGYFVPGRSPLTRTALAVAVASGVGALLELWQMCLPWRSAELLDWVADTAGAVAVGAVTLVYFRARERVPPGAVRE